MRWNKWRTSTVILLLVIIAAMAAIYLPWAGSETLAPARRFVDRAPALPMALVMVWMVLYVLSGRIRNTGHKNL
jgi:hypothetical protein